jgi:hypothetical protein
VPPILKGLLFDIFSYTNTPMYMKCEYIYVDIFPMYTSIHIYMYVYVYVHVSYGMCMDAYMDSDIHMYTCVHGLCIFEDPHMNWREQGSRSLLGTE